MKIIQPDIFGCGIEKLTGGCSDFSVEDVTIMQFLCEDSGNHSRSHSTSIYAESKNETDVCRFAVLVTLTGSGLEDEEHLHALYRCLGEQNITETQAPQAPEGKRKNKISTGIWILVGFGSIVVIVVIVAIAENISPKRCPKSTPLKKKDAFKDMFPKNPACPKVPIKEVYSATDNLSELNFIGEGITGKVYKGILSNKQHVAIKHIINDGNVESFVREVTSSSHVRHPNLVALLGCCVMEDECFLVYEFCPNGNLSEWLFGKDKVLTWIQRLEIAIDSARGLWFLHTYPEGCFVHHDIKPTNILLGTNYGAKLSDFGLSKVIDMGDSYVSSEVRGTFGYVDPEYQSNQRVNPSADVYGFGIVLLQILSGKKVINFNLNKPMPLSKMAKVHSRSGSIAEFSNTKLDGEYSTEAFDLILQLALSCTSLKKQRQSMEQVVERLEEALDISTRAKACTPQTMPEQSFTS
uniref:Protein kinase domain-containing protein n=1 Tax=Fagus sylvatica TaxID=28930 RepID=A0A2N9I700_FAGSY